MIDTLTYGDYLEQSGNATGCPGSFIGTYKSKGQK